MLTRVKAALPTRWRLRLKAGALALAFAAFSLLPWLHLATLGTHAGHGCCQHAAAESPAEHAPALTSPPAPTAPACWVCAGLASLLQHTDPPDSVTSASAAPATLFFAHAARVPAHNHIYPASRSQAPPARA